MSCTDKYSLRIFDNSDIPKIVGLLNTVFKPTNEFTFEWWNWKYKSNPAGCHRDGDIWIAESHKEIVGFYAIMPERLRIGQETITCAQSVDTAVHPQYRK